MRISLAIKGILVAAAAAAPMLCNAESSVQNTSGQTATAHVDFQITVPKFLFLRVGAGSDYTTGAYTAVGTVDQITWTLTPANAGTGPLVGTGGDLGPGTETAALVCNSGNSVVFTSTTLGALVDTTTDSISYSNITVAAAAGTFNTLLNAPALADGATTPSTVTGSGHIVKADAKWTFSYANNTFPPGGVYGGGGTGNTGNGRVTYTATMP